MEKSGALRKELVKRLTAFVRNVEKNDPLKAGPVKARFLIIGFFMLMAILFLPLFHLQSLLLPVLITCSIGGLSNLLSLLWIAWGRGLRYRVFLASFVDVLLITIGLHYLGGIEESFAWVYAVALVVIASRHGLKVGIYTATISSLLYSALLIAEFTGVIRHIDYNIVNPLYIHQDPFYLYIKIFSSVVLFFVTTAVSGFLSEALLRSKSELEKTVASRTDELIRSNEQLQKEVAERKTAEDRFKILFEYAPDAYYLNDLEGVFLDGNRAAEELIGYRTEELTGRTFLELDILPVDQLPIAVANLAANARGEATGPVELTLRRKDSQQVTVEVRTYPVRIGGKLLALGGARDITERKLAENALKKSEQEFRLTFESAKDAIIWADPETGLIINCNKAAEILLEKDRATIIGQNQNTLHPPQKSEYYAEMFRRHLQVEGSADEEAEVITNSGKIVPVRIAASVASVAGRRLIQGVFRDISEQKRAEEALQKSERSYRLLAENVRDVIWTLDIRRLRLTYVSPSVLGQRGYTVEEAMALTLGETLTDASLETAMKGLAGQLDPQNVNREGWTWSRTLDLEQTCKDGSTVWAETTVTFVRDEKGQPVELLGVSRDITDRKQAKQRLEESLSILNATLESTADGILVKDIAGNIQHYNHRFLEMWGIPETIDKSDESSEFRRWMLNQMKYPERAVLVAKEAYEKPQDEGFTILELKDGRVFEMYWHPQKIEGKTVGVVISVRDVTERGKAAESLRESEERYRKLVENARDIICTIDLSSGIITDANIYGEMALGYRYEDVVNRLGFLELVHPDDQEKLVRRLQELSLDGTRKPNFPLRVRKADGAYIDAEINGAIIYGSEDNPESYMGIIRDVTERRRAEEALRQSEEKYRSLFEESKDMVYISTPEGRLLDINPAGVELLGYSTKEEALNDNVINTYGNPDDRRRFLEALEKQGFVKDIELVLKKQDGEYLNVLITSTVVRDEHGSTVAYRGIMRDITEQKKLEQQFFHAQKMESIGTLAGGIAHDFNNILGGILGYASFMKSKVSSEHPFFKYLDTIERSSTRAAELTGQLLGFARRGKYETKPMNLNDAVKETLGIIDRTISKSIAVEARLGEKLPTIEADRGQLQQVLMNLFINAADAMPAGGKLIVETDVETLSEKYARLHMGARPGSYVRLSVTDTGIGMDKKTQERIFEPFFTTKKDGKGTGLGLAMVYGVVKNHEGYIAVYSELGHGTTFKIYMPVSGKVEAENPWEVLAQSGRNELVLVVDDEEAIRDFARMVLESNGYRVILAEDGEQGLRAFEEHNGDISLVILDMVMPNMGGQEAFSRMRARDSGVRALLSTGYSQNGKAQEILDSGVMGFLQKPYRPNVLLAKVRSVIDSET